MCHPALLIAGAGLTVAGGAMSAYGTLQQGKQAKAQADYDAQVALNNAALAKEQSYLVGEQGKVEVDQIRQGKNQMIATGRTAYASGNVAIGSGSELTWEMDTAAQAARDVEMSKANTAMEQWQLENQAQQYVDSSKLSKWQGKTALKNAKIGAVTGLVSSVGSGAAMLGSASLLKGSGELGASKSVSGGYGSASGRLPTSSYRTNYLR